MFAPGSQMPAGHTQKALHVAPWTSARRWARLTWADSNTSHGQQYRLTTDPRRARPRPQPQPPRPRRHLPPTRRSKRRRTRRGVLHTLEQRTTGPQTRHRRSARTHRQGSQPDG
jgi:hypothetical protein